MTLVKICGIMNDGDLASAIDGGADVVAFVVEIEGSRHRISATESRRMIDRLPVFARSVAVIAPKDVDEARGLAELTGADVLQIHGGLSPEEITLLREAVPQRIIAAVPGGSDDAYSMAGAADAVLLDTYRAGTLGGTGEVHDWEASARVAAGLKVPVILAGGLAPANVARAVSTVRPYAVDVSSGVETRGRKDLDKVKAFVAEVRRCR